MKNLRNIIILIVFLIIIVFNVVLLKVNLSKVNTSQEYLEYIKSEQVPNGIESPKFIGKTFSQYSGDVKAIAVSKACYIFTTEILPQYRKECTTEKNTTKYYNKHAGDIFILTGIQTQDEFNKLIEKVKNFNENLLFESYRFDLNDVFISNDYIIVKLYIKYKNCDEFTISVKIYNEDYTDRTSICFSAN